MHRSFTSRIGFVLVGLLLTSAGALALEAPRAPTATAIPSTTTLPKDGNSHLFSEPVILGLAPGNVMSGRGWLSSAQDEEWFAVRFNGVASASVTLQDVALPSQFDLSAYTSTQALVAVAPLGPTGKMLVVHDDGSHMSYLRVSAAIWSPAQPNFTLVAKAM